MRPRRSGRCSANRRRESRGELDQVDDRSVCSAPRARVEGVYSALALRYGMIPPTINYENPDPVCDLDYVPNKARKADIKVALSNSFGFGGTNACVIFRRAE